MLEFIVEKQYGDRMPTVRINETEHLNQQSKIALDMMCRWGLVAANQDGEDSSGRSKLKLATEEEIVKRAVKMTELAFAEFSSRGWITNIPTIKEMKQIVAEEEKKSEEVD